MNIPRHQIPAGGALQPNVAVSTLQKNRRRKTVDILELTCPVEHRIAYRLKAQKYSHFETDITYYKTTVIPFEMIYHKI